MTSEQGQKRRRRKTEKQEETSGCVDGGVYNWMSTPGSASASSTMPNCVKKVKQTMEANSHLLARFLLQEPRHKLTLCMYL
jgi:hypothetical protein